jgi:hypothetical protein
MEKIDLKKSFKEFYKVSSTEVAFIKVPSIKFLMIDGKGSPAEPGYAAAVQALYSVAYTMKFAAKQDGYDYTVMPLEGLWWADDMAAFVDGRQEEWLWTAMIATPDFATQVMMANAKKAVREKKGELPRLDDIRLRDFTEGPAAQITHIGSYESEGPTIAKLHTWILDNGYELTGKHHEIYLNDPGRTAPDKVKTIIRQPIKE